MPEGRVGTELANKTIKAFRSKMSGKAKTA
jgi:hypothetical protein